MDELTKEFLRLISAIPDKEAIYQILQEAVDAEKAKNRQGEQEK